MRRLGLGVVLLVLLVAPALAGKVVHLAAPDWKGKPGPGEVRVRSIGEVRRLLKIDPAVTEVVVHEGIYVGGMSLSTPKGLDPAKQRLTIHAADGAKPVFVGSLPIEKSEPVKDAPGVWSVPYRHRGGEYPKLWDRSARVRYRFVADLAAVRFFPASFCVAGDRLYLRTHDDGPPENVRRSVYDYGIFANRPHVTVRGIAFRDYRVRAKWSNAIDLRTDNITVEDCSASNCSLGFIINGKNGVVRNCRAEDCGGAVYVGGENATVEDCRLFKPRDRFMVPMYHQDDTGIQYYYPAHGGVIRGNLCVGFATGIFIKAKSAPYLIEHNTIDGAGQGTGFGATKWAEGEQFRYNIIVNCARQVEVPPKAPKSDMHHNALFGPDREKLSSVGPATQIVDPKFVWPEYGDYRLKNDSPCLKLAQNGRPCGALPAIGDAKVELGEPREWHVSPAGRDGREGTAERPIRTIQFAVDRAKPGDRIILQPGIYPEPVVIKRGGSKERPIVIRAAGKWKAILDSNREADVMVRIENAPYIEIRDVEIRWYGKVAIHLNKSPNVTVEGCRIWNAPWYGTWPTGSAMRVNFSPGFVAHRNVLFRQEHAVWLYNSPRSRITHNTCVGNLYSAAAFLYSVEGSVCRNNSFAYQGNDVLVIHAHLNQKAKLKTFDCDYNNYGTSQRAHGAGAVFDSLTPREKERYLSYGSKAVVNYTEWRGKMNRILAMKAWREFSGLDAHSIFADPLYADTANRDFRLAPKSPNIRAGKDDATLGALGVAE